MFACLTALNPNHMQPAPTQITGGRETLTPAGGGQQPAPICICKYIQSQYYISNFCIWQVGALKMACL